MSLSIAVFVFIFKPENLQMIDPKRMPLIMQMGGEIIQLANRLRRIEYKVIPSTKIDPADIKSLRAARYRIEYGRRSESLDIEEVTVLSQVVVQHKQAFESIAHKLNQPAEIEIKMTVSGQPPDDLILALAAKTTFSEPPNLN
jgi:hypothetical protein